MATPADLDALKARLGIKGGATDEQLDRCLDVALAWVGDRVVLTDPRPADVTEAIYLMASRMYARRNSPEGVAGWGDLGVVRIIGTDPDITSLLERHLDFERMGIA